MPTVSDILTPRGRAAIVASIFAGVDSALEALSLPPVSAEWSPSDLVYEAITGVSVAIEKGDMLAALLATMASLSTAEGELLTIRTEGFEQVSRFPALVPTGFVTVLNASGQSQTFTAGVDGFRNPQTRITYLATETIEVANGASAAIPVAGSTLGTAQDTPTGTVTELSSTRVGVSCTNIAGISGAEAESDGELRRRAALAPIARQAYATLAKWENAARDVGAHGVPVNRVSVRRVPDGVRVILAKTTGALDAGEVAAVSSWLAAHVQGDSGTLDVASADPEALPSATITLWAHALDPRDDAAIILAAQNAVAAEIATAPIGGYRIGATNQYPGDRITTALGNLGLAATDGVPGDLSLSSEAVAVASDFTFVVGRVI